MSERPHDIEIVEEEPLAAEESLLEPTDEDLVSLDIASEEETLLSDEDLTPSEAPLAERPAYYEQARRYPLLTKDQEIELGKRVQQGDEAAFEKFFHSNLRLVMSVAHRMKRRAHQLDYDDLVVEGSFGLMRAIQKYDHTRGFKFSTYAIWWIRQSIDRAIKNDDRTMRVPVHILEKLTSASMREAELERELGRQPTDAEVAARVGLDEEGLVEIRRKARLTSSLYETKIYSSTGGEEDGVSLINLIPDPNPTDPSIVATEFGATAVDENDVARKAIAEALALNVLDDRGRSIIEQRYGLVSQQKKTLEQVGAELGITRERVRQLQAKAEKILLPTVRLMLVQKNLLSKEEGEIAQLELMIAARLPARFEPEDTETERMIEAARREYRGDELELVEDFLERWNAGNLLTAEQDEDLMIHVNDEDSMAVLKAEYMCIALIAAAPYITDDEKFYSVDKAYKAFEAALSSMDRKTTGARLRNTIFKMVAVDAKASAREYLQTIRDKE